MAAKVALIGDSTTNTWYLSAAKNTLLQTNFAKPASFDGTLAGLLQAQLGPGYDVGNFGLDGRTATSALSESLTFVQNRPPVDSGIGSGAVNCPINYTGTMWNACKSWSPDIVVMSFGINDSKAPLTLDDYKTAIDTVAADCVALGIELIFWNGANLKYGPNDEGAGAARNAILAPYFDYGTQKAMSIGGNLADTRQKFINAQSGVTWDLFGHNDGSMLAAWNTAPEPPLLYANVHQWIVGNELIAEAIADTVMDSAWDVDVDLRNITPWDIDIDLRQPGQDNPPILPSGWTGTGQHRLFFKDRLNPAGAVKSVARIVSYTIEKDALVCKNSTFTVDTVPLNVNEGDIAVVVDQFGTNVYEGIVMRSDSLSEVECEQMQSLFRDAWIYDKTSATTIEQTILNKINGRFRNSTDPREYAAFNPWQMSVSTSTPGALISQAANTVVNFDDFLYQMFDKFLIVPCFSVPFSESNPTITIGKSIKPKVVLGDNSRYVFDVRTVIEIAEVNKLVIFSASGAYRTTYYSSNNGIVADASELSRLSTVNTSYVFSDDSLSAIVALNLSSDMYNHKIEVDLALNSGPYDFWDFELGQTFDVWTNGHYFNTILTGYKIEKSDGLDITVTTLTFGKVRTKLTDKWRLIH